MIDASTRLRRAILLNDVDLVRRIVRNSPEQLHNADFADKSNTSLHLAAKHGFTEIAAHLLDAGHERSSSGGGGSEQHQHSNSGVEISRNTDHETPLMLAARHGQVETGALLLRRCPQSIRCTNSAGLDALALAAQNADSTALISLLLQNPDHPASVETRDIEGNTALHHASASGSLKALRILLSAGANPYVKNSYEWTPLAYSQTVAAEVYFKSLIADLERRKAEGARLDEERERQRAAGLRIVGHDDSFSSPAAAAGGVGAAEGDTGGLLQTPVDEEERISDALQRHWSPTERKRPSTPGSAGKLRDWDGRSLMQLRSRSGSNAVD